MYIGKKARSRTIEAVNRTKKKYCIMLCKHKSRGNKAQDPRLPLKFQNPKKLLLEPTGSRRQTSIIHKKPANTSKLTARWVTKWEILSKKVCNHEPFGIQLSINIAYVPQFHFFFPL
ncbi:unnamed protein product, partial [Alopecurus aequalis]